MNTGSLSWGFTDARARAGHVWPAVCLLLGLVCIAAARFVFGGAADGPRRALAIEADLVRGVAFGLVLPLFSYAASAHLGHRIDGLMRSSAARYGEDRRVFALGRLAFSAAAAFAIVLTCGSFALSLSGLAQPAAGSGASAGEISFYCVLGTAALGAVSYASYMELAHLLGGGAGRASFLIADWFFGSGVGLTAWLWPRAHLRSLLGGELPVGSSPSAAIASLLVASCLAALIYARRIPR